MNPSRIFVLRPVATSLLMAGVLLAGFVAFRQLPISALPEVDYPTIQVATTYPGASRVSARSSTAESGSVGDDSDSVTIGVSAGLTLL